MVLLVCSLDVTGDFSVASTKIVHTRAVVATSLKFLSGCHTVACLALGKHFNSQWFQVKGWERNQKHSFAKSEPDARGNWKNSGSNPAPR